MSISIELADSFPSIQADIHKALASALNKRIAKRVRRSRNTVKGYIHNWMMESEEIQSLLEQGIPNSLNAVFGLPPGKPDDAVRSIVAAISEAVTVDFQRISNELEGGATFHFQPKDFTELLGLPQGHQLTEMGTDLHWLEWLLTKGDTVVVKGFLYQPSNSGRSGGGTMDIGGVFRVPPRFSGTVENNFINRAFLGKNLSGSPRVNRDLAKILTSFLE